MVGYIKHHFFVRYRAFHSWAHLNQLAEQWLREEADQRKHGTVQEIVAERFAREQPQLQRLAGDALQHLVLGAAPGELGRVQPGALCRTRG